MNLEATTTTPSSRVRQPLPRLSRRQLLSLLPALSVLPQVACAARPQPAWPPAALELVDRDSGQLLTVYRQGGRSYVAGRPGARYALRLRNLAPRRVLMVLSVDGVNVVSGQTAAFSQTGYVLEPGQTSDITGWRKSDHEVAAFEFAALEDSYAARTGRPDHVGVIGLAAFVEKAPEPPPLPAPVLSERSDASSRSERSDGPARPAAAAAPASALAKSAEAVGASADARARATSRAWAPATARAKARWCSARTSSVHRPRPTRCCASTTTVTNAVNSAPRSPRTGSAARTSSDRTPSTRWGFRPIGST